jgi:hypothetical protein
MEGMAKYEFTALITEALDEADLKPSNVGITADDEGRVVLVLEGLTLDEHENVVKTEREYTVTGRFHVEAQVTVTASSEDEARELADDKFGSVSFDFGYGDVEVTDVQFDEVLEADER